MRGRGGEGEGEGAGWVTGEKDIFSTVKHENLPKETI